MDPRPGPLILPGRSGQQVRPSSYHRNVLVSATPYGSTNGQVVTTPLPTVLLAEELRVLRASPWALLAHFSGEPRGFWGRGSGWVAHGGVAVDLRAEGEDRFGEARRWIASLADCGDGDVRMFGGFTFSERSSVAPHWAAFPAARFQVPRIELRSDGETFRLIAREALPPGGDEGTVRQRLRRTLAALERKLAEGVPEPVANGHPTQGTGAGGEARSRWVATVQKALVEIEGGNLRKVVLARSEKVRRSGLVDSLEATRRLFAPRSQARVFLFEPEAGRAFLGASPETLARVHGGEAQATAVAGSIQRGDSPDEDARLADLLLDSEKDLREQGFVVREMVARLAAIGGTVKADPTPHVLTLPGIHHLESRVRAELPDTVTALDLIERLHPTPAVCGQPNAGAFEFIEREEGLDRGWYGAPVGWLDAHGNGVTAPALRCALLEGSEVHFFAGAGIVSGSDPQREWEETRLKLETARAALGSVLNGPVQP